MCIYTARFKMQPTHIKCRIRPTKWLYLNHTPQKVGCCGPGNSSMGPTQPLTTKSEELLVKQHSQWILRGHKIKCITQKGQGEEETEIFCH